MFLSSSWWLSPLFYEDAQILYFPAPLSRLGMLLRERLIIFRQGPKPGTGHALFCAGDPEVELGAAQGGNADAIELGSGLDVVLRAPTVAQIFPQPFGGELAGGQAGSDGAGGRDLLGGELAGTGPGEGAGVVDGVSQGGSEAAQVGFHLHQCGQGGCIEAASDEELGADCCGELDGGQGWTPFAEMADEENTAAMLLRQVVEVVEEATGLVGAVAISGPEVTVQGIDDEEAGVGSLEGVFKHGCVAEAERGRLGGAGGEDSAEQDQARGVAVEAGEAGADEFGASVVGGGIEDGAGLAVVIGVDGGGDSSSTECGGDGQGNPGFSGAGIAREHG
jgi:hypothetical protein